MAPRRKLFAAIIGVSALVSTASACSESAPPPPAADAPTFTKEIEPLVREKCQGCHREGGIAPFPLVTFEQLRDLAVLAKEKVTRREMPPWGAFSEPNCTVRRPFKGDLSMTPEQIATFARWVDGGMLRGDGPPGPPAAVPPITTKLAGPTQTFVAAETFEVPGRASDLYRCFPIDPGFGEDAWVSESIVVPANPGVVHHALVYIDEEREGVARAKGGDSYPCFGGPELAKQSLVLAWSPGGVPTTYGEGAALRIPKNAHLVLQVHYHPLADPASGALRLELATLPAPPSRAAAFVLLGNAERAEGDAWKLLPGPNDPHGRPEFWIPSNAKGHTETMELVLGPKIRDARIAVVGSHMHWAGVGLKLEVVRAHPRDGEPTDECLLSEPRYDFNWQRTYAYDAPIDALPVVRANDTLRVTCTYDNSADNPHIARLMQEDRQRVPADIGLGATARDEMCQGILSFVDEIAPP